MDNSYFFKQVEEYLDGFVASLQARTVTPLNNDWRFSTGEMQAMACDFDDSGWRLLNLPHDFSMEGGFSNQFPSSGSGGWVQTGVVWYRKHFYLPQSNDGGKLFILFDGVSMNSSVWINGHFLGNRPSGFTPFWYDISPYVVTDEAGKNVIAVKADTTLQPYSRFYHGTGIYRPVSLIATDALHIDLWGVTAVTESISESQAMITVKTDVRVGAFPETKWYGFGAEPQQNASMECMLETTILDCNGRTIAQTVEAISILNFESHTIRQTLTVAEPKFWSVGTPSMYRIQSRLFAGDVVIDDVLTPLGIRQISWDAPAGFAINGVSTKLKGVCLHQDSAPWGGAVPVKTWVRKLLTLKAMGCNAVRTSHHPFPAEFYHCCDYLGMLVMDEAFDEWQKGWDRDFSEQPYGKNTYGYYQYFAQWHDADLRAMIRQDRNHPSVIMWSIGNEIPELYYSEGESIVKELMRICREEDMSRPITVCAEGQYRMTLQHSIMEHLDIKGLNYVNTRNPGYYEGFHAEHPDWVMLGTETFFDPGHIPAIGNHFYVAGQFLWVGYDYLGEAFDFKETVDHTTGAKRLQHGWVGMIDVLDTPRAEYYYRQSLWAEEPVVHMAVKTDEWVQEKWNQIRAESSWNWDSGDTKTIYCFTNCEEAELLLNGVSLGRRKKDLNDPLPLICEIQYSPGILELIGYREGKRACSHTLETVGEVYDLALSCDDMLLQADGQDTAQVVVSVVDREGRVVPGAVHRISIAVSGAGVLAYTVNGDMNDAEGYCSPSCLTVNGRCMAIIRTGLLPGAITLTAQAEGLAQAAIEIITERKH